MQMRIRQCRSRGARRHGTGRWCVRWSTRKRGGSKCWVSAAPPPSPPPRLLRSDDARASANAFAQGTLSSSPARPPACGARRRCWGSTRTRCCARCWATTMPSLRSCARRGTSREGGVVSCHAAALSRAQRSTALFLGAPTGTHSDTLRRHATPRDRRSEGTVSQRRCGLTSRARTSQSVPRRRATTAVRAAATATAPRPAASHDVRCAHAARSVARTRRAADVHKHTRHTHAPPPRFGLAHGPERLAVHPRRRRSP